MKLEIDLKDEEKKHLLRCLRECKVIKENAIDSVSKALRGGVGDNRDYYEKHLEKLKSQSNVLDKMIQTLR